MKIIITFMLLFFTNCLVPAAISATVNVKNGVSNSVILAPKKLTYKQRVVRNYLNLKAKFKRKLSGEALTFVITGAIFLVFGVFLLVRINSNNNNLLPQGNVPTNSSSGFATVIAIVSIGAGLLSFFIALLVSI